MIEGRAEVIIRRPPEAILAFVSDLERYKLADWKIGRVIEQRRDPDGIYMRHDGKLRGIPGPPVSLKMTVREDGVSYRSVPTFPSRLMIWFDGGFEVTRVADGTRVLHIERFHFRAPWKWVAEPFLRNWLQSDVQAEMGRLKDLLEAAPTEGRE